MENLQDVKIIEHVDAIIIVCIYEYGSSEGLYSKN